MLALTKQSEYAVIALCHLARDPGRVISAREISSQYRVPLPLLMNTLKLLQKNGLLISVRGAQGGYRLRDAAGAISLEQVLMAIDGPTGIVQCSHTSEGESGSCDILGTCPIRLPMHRVNEMLRRFIAGVSIADLCAESDFARAVTDAGSLKVMQS